MDKIKKVSGHTTASHARIYTQQRKEGRKVLNSHLPDEDVSWGRFVNEQQ